MHGENLWKFTETRPRAPRARHASILPRSKVQYHGMHTAQPRPGTATPASARPARAAWRWAPTYGRGGDRPRRQGLRARGQQLGLRGDHPRHGGLGGATAARPGLVPLRGSAHRARGVARAGQHAAHDRPASGGGRGAGGRGRGRRRAGAARAGRGGRGGGGGDDGRGQGGHLRSGGAPAAACLAAHCGDEGDA